jgi:hypothetical protein
MLLCEESENNFAVWSFEICIYEGHGFLGYDTRNAKINEQNFHGNSLILSER